MRYSTPIVLLALVAVIIVNGLAWWGANTMLWPWQHSLYFYWGESMLLGAFALFVYAKHLLVFFLLLAGVSSMLGLSHFTFMGEMKIPLAFWGIYSLFWLAYFEIRMSPLSRRIRLMHPFYQLLFYLAYMAGAIAATFALTGYIYFGRIFVPAMQTGLMEQFLIMVVGIPTLTIGILKIVDMIGERHVVHFLLGTYHRPVEKKRIVLFLDMVGSSAAAEKLPPKKSMEMIARFIFDAGASFRAHGGDIINYTGDGLVVLWTIYQADKVIRAIDSLSARISGSRESYERHFGIVPDFRIGIHAGPVVISQIGEEKLFLGVYGDVVNTAARIEQMNKELGTRILMSKGFKHYLSLPAQRIKPMGMTEVRGKEESIEIFTLQSD